MALVDRGHDVLLANNGERCLEIYNGKLQNIRYSIHSTANIQPFDIVILDHKMPRINGLDVAKEILTVYPHQRILFISAYTKGILEEAVANIEPLKQHDRRFNLNFSLCSLLTGLALSRIPLPTSCIIYLHSRVSQTLLRQTNGESS
jgi:CheY-like chemotaxis protein